MGEPLSKNDLLVGVDLGGTKILSGVFDHKLRLIGRSRISTKPKRGPDEVIKRIARCISDAVDDCDLDLKQVKGIGIGAPGPVDPSSGRVLFAPNLPDWTNIPLQKTLGKLLDLPVFVENDCSVCTLGVHRVEFKGKPNSLVGIFLGTGIGGGLIINGQLYSGYNRTAGEIGHMVLEVNGPKCGCGNHGCFEALAGRAGLFRRIEAEVKDGKKTILTEMLGDDLKDLRSGDLRKALRKGDKLVEKLLEEVAEYTGIAIANIINVLNPEVIALGGGMMQQLSDDLMSIIVETAMEYAMTGTAKGIEIVASELGDDAGITGAAVLAQMNVE